MFRVLTPLPGNPLLTHEVSELYHLPSCVTRLFRLLMKGIIFIMEYYYVFSKSFAAGFYFEVQLRY